MRGEIDFKQSLRQRLSLLAGLDAARLPEIAARLRFTEGLERLFTNLKALGLKTAIVSGGFSYFAQHLQQRLGMDYAFANDLPMLRMSGLGIAFHAKPTVREGARQSISSLGLDSILYLIGVRDHDALA